jgi:hypothetical protein
MSKKMGLVLARDELARRVSEKTAGTIVVAPKNKTADSELATLPKAIDLPQVLLEKSISTLDTTTTTVVVAPRVASPKKPTSPPPPLQEEPQTASELVVPPAAVDANSGVKKLKFSLGSSSNAVAPAPEPASSTVVTPVSLKTVSVITSPKKPNPPAKVKKVTFADDLIEEDEVAVSPSKLNVKRTLNFDVPETKKVDEEEDEEDKGEENEDDEEEEEDEEGNEEEDDDEEEEGEEDEDVEIVASNKKKRDSHLIDDDAEMSGEGHDEEEGSDIEHGSDVDETGNIKGLLASDDEEDEDPMEVDDDDDDDADKKKKKKRKVNPYAAINAKLREADLAHTDAMVGNLHKKGRTKERSDAFRSILGSKIKGGVEKAAKEIYGLDEEGLANLAKREDKAREEGLDDDDDLDMDDLDNLKLGSADDEDEKDEEAAAEAAEKKKLAEMPTTQKVAARYNLVDFDDFSDDAPAADASASKKKDTDVGDAMDIDEPPPAPKAAPTLQTGAIINRQAICQKASVQVLEKIVKLPVAQKYLADEIYGDRVLGFVKAVYTAEEAGPLKPSSDTTAAQRMAKQVHTYLQEHFTTRANDVLSMVQELHTKYPGSMHVARIKLLVNMLTFCPISIVQGCRATSDTTCTLTGEKIAAGAFIDLLAVKAGDRKFCMPLALSVPSTLPGLHAPVSPKKAPDAAATEGKPKRPSSLADLDALAEESADDLVIEKNKKPSATTKKDAQGDVIMGDAPATTADALLKLRAENLGAIAKIKEAHKDDKVALQEAAAQHRVKAATKVLDLITPPPPTVDKMEIDNEEEPEVELETEEVVRPTSLMERLSGDWTRLYVNAPVLVHWLKQVRSLAVSNSPMVAYAVKDGVKPPVFFDDKGMPRTSEFAWVKTRLFEMMSTLFRVEENWTDADRKKRTSHPNDRRLVARGSIPIYYREEAVRGKITDHEWQFLADAFESLKEPLFQALLDVLLVQKPPAGTDTTDAGNVRLLDKPFQYIGEQQLGLESPEVRKLFPLIDKTTGKPSAGDAIDVSKFRFYPRLLCSLFEPVPVYIAK